MKNVFIITLGTREIQFRAEKLHQFDFEIDEKRLLKHPRLEASDILLYPNDNYPGFYCCSFPRIAGKTILENYELFKPVLEFPLIDHAFSNIIKEHRIDNMMLVYTDQQDLDLTNSLQRRNFNRDTLYFRDILRLHLGISLSASEEDHPVDIPVTHKATDIDFQYRYFARKCRILFEMEKDIEQVFLLAQGGIDQINHALTLQLIQAFGDKVKLWQQAEGEGPRNLQFPFMFIKDLNKQKILKHLEDYDFGLLNIALTDNELVLNLAKYADARLNLRHDTVKCHIIFLENWMPGDLIVRMKKEVENCDDLTRIRDLFISAKIKLIQENYSDFVWRLFTIAENLFAVKLDQILPNPRQFYNSKYKSNDSINSPWESALRLISNELPDYLKSKNVFLNNPNRRSLYEIFIYTEQMKGNNELKQFIRVFKQIEKLAQKRNNLAHNLQPIKKEQLDSFFKTKYSLKAFIKDIDDILLVDGLDTFSLIKEKIHQIILSEI